MGKSVKLTDGSYIDAEGVYDATQGYKQSDINEYAMTKLNKIAVTNASKIAFWTAGGTRIQIVAYLNDGTGDGYGLTFFWTEKRISMWFYDASEDTYTTLWSFT